MKFSAKIKQIRKARKSENSDLFYNLLNELEYSVEYFYEDEGNNWFFTDLDKLYLENIREYEVVDEYFGLDYNLEAIRTSKIITENNYPNLLKFISLPKEKDKGLENENHGIGYHIHYHVLHRGKPLRTNVIFTFSKSKLVPSNGPSLFWEYHGGGLEKHPDKFKKRRRMAIYDTSCNFLRKIPIEEFKNHSSESTILWPNIK